MFLLFNIIGILIFLFVFWKKLKEDYLPNQIFATSFFMLFSSLIFYFISREFVFHCWFWLTFLGISTGLAFGILRFKMKFFESFEASFLGFLIWFSLYFLADSVKNSSPASFLGFVVLVLLIGIFNFLDFNYKNFSWYRSGKIGLSGLLSAFIFFLIRSVFSGFFPETLSFVPKFEVILSGIASFIFLFLTYNLSRKEP